MKVDWTSTEFYQFLEEELKTKSKKQVIEEYNLRIATKTFTMRLEKYHLLGAAPLIKSIIGTRRKQITLEILQHAIDNDKHITELASEGFSVKQINALVKKHKLVMPRFNPRAAAPIDMDRFHELYKTGFSATMIAGFLKSSKTHIDQLINQHYPKKLDAAERPPSAFLPPEVKTILFSKWK